MYLKLSATVLQDQRNEQCMLVEVLFIFSIVNNVFLAEYMLFPLLKFHKLFPITTIMNIFACSQN